MAKKRKKYTKEFKLEAVKLASKPNVTVKQVAEDLGVHDTMIHRWRKELSVEGDDAFRGNGRLRADEEEIRKLKVENKRLREERDILKKATLFFAREGRRK